MADNTNDNTNGSGTHDQNKDKNKGDGSQQRFEELSGKLSAQEKRAVEAEERAKEAEKKAADADFKASMAGLASKPELKHASEFEEDIRQRVAKGYSVEDAAFSVLREKGKLETADAGDRTADIAGTEGGSAAIASTSGKESIEKKDPDKMNREELREAMTHGQATGQIRLTE